MPTLPRAFGYPTGSSRVNPSRWPLAAPLFLPLARNSASVRLSDLLTVAQLSTLCSHSTLPSAITWVEPVFASRMVCGVLSAEPGADKHASSVQAEVSLVCWSESPAFLSHPLASCGDLVLGEWDGGEESTAHRPCPRLDSSVRSLLGIWPSKQGTHVSLSQVGGASVQVPQPVRGQVADHAPGRVSVPTAWSCVVHVLPSSGRMAQARQ